MINYRGKKLKIKQVDGFTMIINSKKSKDGFSIFLCKFFGGGDVSKLKKCYVVEKAEFSAHGENLKECLEDVNFKYLQSNLDTSKLIQEILKKQTVSKEEYRLLTGACRMGVKNFMDSNKITSNELPIKKVVKITRGHYGHEKLKELLQC